LTSSRRYRRLWPTTPRSPWTGCLGARELLPPALLPRDDRALGLRSDAGATDEFIRLLAAIGPAEEAIDGVRRYRDCGASSPCVGGISGTDFDATLEALAKSLD
jgi:hypothetical protein